MPRYNRTPNDQFEAIFRLVKRRAKQRRNRPEALFEERATKAGWKVTKRGWPDFIISKNGETRFVEVKQDKDDLKESQLTVMKVLAAHGLKCYRWSPKNGFTQIKGNK